MATITTPSDARQNRPAWAWNSINTLVENTKTASESFFDNVTATLTKKGEQQNGDGIQIPQAQPNPLDENTSESEDWKHWKSMYAQLKHAHTLKTAMLDSELQKYKDKHLSLNRHMSLQTESKMAKLKSQITKHKQNEAKCIHILNDNIHRYYENIDYLQHQMDNKYKVFYDKLVNVTVKAGLNPDDIFNDNEDTIEHIYNAEEFIENTKTGSDPDPDPETGNDYKIEEDMYKQQMIELKDKLRESEASLDLFRNKFLDLVQRNDDLKEENNALNKEYKELSRLFESMSDQNTEFQQQIKDVETENTLLRKQLNEYKTQNETGMSQLMSENEKLNESLSTFELKYSAVSAKLTNEYGVSDQLRDQIKQISKTLHKKSKSNSKYKKKMEIVEKEKAELKYIKNEQEKKLKKYNEKIGELEAEQSKYNQAISMYKSLQNEISQYILDNAEMKHKITDLENELIVIKDHATELRKQSKRDSLNISRLTDCNDALLQIMQQCEDILIERAHKYLPISVMNDNELELTDSEDDYKETLITNDDENKSKKVIYFNESESDSDLCEMEEEDNIFRVSKAKDLIGLQSAARLKIQVSMLSEQLEKLHNETHNFKRELHRSEEENMRQQHELREIAMRKRLQMHVRKELEKRERNMVSIASMRGVNMKHNVSLANLTKTQDKVDGIINNMKQNDSWFRRNISRQLSGNTKSKAMAISQSPLSVCSLMQYEDLETQSMRSWSSNVSKKSALSQSAVSLCAPNSRKRNKKRNAQAHVHGKRANMNVIQPMQTIQSQTQTPTQDNDEKNKSKKSFTSRWF